MPEYSVAYGSRTYVVSVAREGTGLRVVIDGQVYPVVFGRWLGSTHYVLTRGASVTPVVIRTAGDERLVGIADEQYRVRVTRRVPVARKGGGVAAATSREVRAPMPGLVVSVRVEVGETVEAGRALAIIEAMKMQSEIRAPVAGRVSAVRAQAGQEVMGGAVLLTIEPSG
ncbi:MAG TPA: acetyl-CoA carboxylase biotin carboxyl carrier protein subunit [bacterium]|nr:acetyl-CoA carboxylase biotin carboxyl carrier protein subunit [bacterium]